MALLLIAALAQAQKPPTAQQKQAAKAHFQQGKAYYDAGAWDDAVREYEAAYALVPLPELQFNIGQALRMKGDKPQAIAAYQRYLDRLPDGALADEARNHIAALKLKIQVEEAETARKRAVEAAEAARRRADEETAARKRAEAEAAARGGLPRADEEQLRRVAAETERARRAKEHEEVVRKQRTEEAGLTGRGLRITGIVAASVGVAALGFAAFWYWGPTQNRFKAIDRFNNNPGHSWAPDDVSLSQLHTGQKVVTACVASGASLVVTGVALYVWGRVRRGQALEKLPPVSLVPVLGSSAGSLAVMGRF